MAAFVAYDTPRRSHDCGHLRRRCPAVEWSKGCERNVHDAYEPRGPEGTDWRGGPRWDAPPANGPDLWLPAQHPGSEGGSDDPSATARFDDHRAAGPYAGPDRLTGRPAPDSRMPRPADRDDAPAGTAPFGPQDAQGQRPLDHTGHSAPPPGPASFDPQGAQRSLRDHGGDPPGGYNGRTPDRAAREHTGHSAPPPAPASFDPQRAQRSQEPSGDPQRRLGGHDASAPASSGGERPSRTAPPGGGRPPHRDEAEGEPYVERAVPPGEQVRATVDRVSSAVRRSVPLRTLLFLLPPLALPPLAFDLSLLATLVVALTLLWIAAAAGVFATMMLEGTEHVTLRAIERKLADLPATDGGSAGVPDAALQDALMAIGAQLDRLDDRVAALADAGNSDRDNLQALSHRPEERVPDSFGDEQYDRYGQTAVPDTNWGESRWRR